ncbi:MAG: fold metallo-hydrolase [Paenibacillaceae bacterium]|jgi:glyoxylase-like metal-dependent hydrolase (beta-lactamase superfamily II)|nr:fold metallo-hydrolase [Paenibacillaceae bacterium]
MIQEGILTGIPVELKLFAAGYCRHPEFFTIRGGSWRAVPFPAGFALIRHPQQGYILFDTGYSRRFVEETKRLPQLLYRMITPVTFREEDSAVCQLKRLGIGAEEIGYVVLSHFHADHTAGLRDFPNARFIYKQEGYAAVKKLSPFAAVKAGYLSGLLPGDFEERSGFMEDTAPYRLPVGFPFAGGYDLFGDGSLVAVDLPGHAAGQTGLLLRTADGEYFLCADAVWSSRAFRENRRPHAAARIIMADAGEYGESFRRLIRLHKEFPQLRIVPSHCSEALRRYGKGGGG